jgi:hypothetical protein
MWNMRKIPFFSLLKNSRSEAVSQGRAFSSAPRERSERSAEPLRTAQRRLHARERAARPVPLGSFLFNTFTPQQPWVTAR